MASGYSKEFLIDAFTSRYEFAYPTKEARISHRKLAEKCYDEVGKDKFRIYASLDAEAIRKFKLECDA